MLIGHSSSIWQRWLPTQYCHSAFSFSSASAFSIVLRHSIPNVWTRFKYLTLWHCVFLQHVQYPPVKAWFVVYTHGYGILGKLLECNQFASESFSYDKELIFYCQHTNQPRVECTYIAQKLECRFSFFLFLSPFVELCTFLIFCVGTICTIFLCYVLFLILV